MKNMKSSNKPSLKGKENTQINELRKGLGLIIKKSDSIKIDDELGVVKQEFQRSQTTNLSSPKKKKSLSNIPSAKKSLKSIMLEKEFKRNEENHDCGLGITEKLSDFELHKANSEIFTANKEEENIDLCEYSHDFDYHRKEKEIDDEDSNNLKVVVRFRPVNQFETNIGGNLSIVIINETSLELHTAQGKSTFTLDKVFEPATDQETLFEEVAMPTIQDILKGYNGTIFTYGQSGSGKTHTMYGSNLFDPELKGIIPRSIDYIFDVINDPKNIKIKFQIKFSMLEIYKENLYDLLDPTISSKELKIKETKDRHIYIKNLTEVYIHNIDDFLMLIDQAENYRVVCETGLNKQSSRSHLLFIIEISQELPNGTVKCGKLNLVDLAGSEKISKTGAVGEMLEEAKKINLGLSALGNVISGLSGEKDYIPYRDSKLTRILQDSLGGNYKTSLIVACSPHMFNCEETSATLKFAHRAKKIKNKVHLNIKKSPEELQKMINELNLKLKVANEEVARLSNIIKESNLALSKNGTGSPKKKASLKDAVVSTGKQFKKSQTVTKPPRANSINNKQALLSIPIKKEINEQALIESEYQLQTAQRTIGSSSDLCITDRIEINKLTDLVKINEQDSNTSLNSREVIHNSKTNARDYNEMAKLQDYLSSKPRKSNLFNIQENSKEIMNSKEEDSESHKASKSNEIVESAKKIVIRNHNDDALSDHSKGCTTLTGTAAKATIDSCPSLNPILKVELQEEHLKKTNLSNLALNKMNSRNVTIGHPEFVDRNNKRSGTYHLKGNHDFQRELKQKDDPVIKMSLENERLKSSIKLVNEKFIQCKDKLNAYEKNEEKHLNDMIRIEVALSNLESHIMKIGELIGSTLNKSDSILLEALEKENLELKAMINKQEKIYLDSLKQIKCIENEMKGEDDNNKEQSLKDKIFEGFKISEPDYSLYKESYALGQSFMSKVLSFINCKSDFFRASIYKSLDLQYNNNQAQLEHPYVKSALMKSSILTIFYENQLLSLMNKMRLDLKMKQILSNNRSLYSNSISEFSKLFESVQVIVNSLKKLREEETYNIKMKNASNIIDYKDFTGKGSMLKVRPPILEKRSNSLYSSIISNSLSNHANESANLKKIKIHSCFDSNIVELKSRPEAQNIANFLEKVNSTERKSETSSELKRSGSASSCSSSSSLSSNYEVKFDDANKRINNFNSINALQDFSRKPHNVSRRANIAISNVSELPIFHLNKSINLEANKENILNAPIKLSMRKIANFPNSDTGNGKFEFPADKICLNISSANNFEKSGNIFLSELKGIQGVQSNDNLSEIKQLKDEIETLKHCISILKLKITEDEIVKDKSSEAVREYEKSSHIIYKKELCNIQNSFDIMRKFYEEEFDTKINIIEGLSTIIDNLVINTGEQLSYSTTVNDKTIKSLSNSTNVNNLKSVSALHKKTVSCDEFTQRERESSDTKASKLNLSNKILYSTCNDHHNASLRSCMTPIKSYFNNKRSNVIGGKRTDSNTLVEVFFDESGSATKKCDYIKLEVDENQFKVKYGNGLYCKNQGKSPLVRTLKFPPKGDTFNESFLNQMTNTET